MYFLEYFRLPGSKFSYITSDEKRAGGVGVYIKNCINYKFRNEIVSVNEKLEHLWIKLQGKDKRSSYLKKKRLKNVKKDRMIEKIGSVLSSIKRICKR